MQKCPFCAEEIQDDAIVCKFCRNEIHSMADIQKLIKGKQRFLWSLPIICLLESLVCYYVIKTAYLDPGNPLTIQSFLLAIRFIALLAEFTFLGFTISFLKLMKQPWFGTIVYSFLSLSGLAIISYFGLWIYSNKKIRNLKNELEKNYDKNLLNVIVKSGSGTFPIISLIMIISGIFAMIFIQNGNYSTTAPLPTTVQRPINTQQPTATEWPTPLAIIRVTATQGFTCYQWSEITPSMAGRKVCVYGTVANIYNTTVSSTRIKFTSKPNSFFLDDVEYIFPDLRVGDCAYAEDYVRLYNNIPYMSISDLYHCEAWMK
jgi:hypothetical protein